MNKIGLIGCLIVLFWGFQGAQISPRHRSAERLDPSALQEDFTIFRQSLKQYHPGLYTYASKSQIDSAFAAIEAKLDQPMSELGFYQLLSPLKSLIKDGHTYFYPSSERKQEVLGSGSLPFQAYWDGQSLWARHIYYTDIALSAGDEILSINGLEAKEIARHLMSNIIRDGKNVSYPRWIMNHWFGQIYRYHYETSEQWELEILDTAGNRRKLRFENQPSGGVPEEGEKPKGIELRYEGEVGLLKVPSFNNVILRTRYQQRFRPEIKAAFETLQQNQTKSLILDLRDNQGGTIDYGRYLLSYLLEERFALVQALKKVSEPLEEQNEKRLTDKSFAKLGWTEPKKHHFRGKLIVLMNGGSFSCTGAVLAQLKAADRAEFVGEAAAGNNSVFCGVGPTEILPNSKITLAVPRVQFYVVDRSQNVGHGVLPDHYLFPTITDLIDERDVELEKALSLF
ncbi:MAG: S41 family peptidase [Bacteroidia bacterium]